MKWEKLLMPSGIDRDQSTLEDSFAEIVLQPLERGVGLTLGNALRRTLLAAIQGAAISAVKIDGVRHELSIVPGVTEDVTDILLNLKQVVFSYERDEPCWISLKAEGEGEVSAGQIQVPEGVKIVNPDQHICTLGEGGSIDMEMYVVTGRGYVDREDVEGPEEAIGVIRLDANFSPIRRVSYRVEDTRVGQQTDYDRLVLTVETDGSITPEDAVGHAAKIIKDYVQLLINFDEAPLDEQESTVDEGTEKVVELLRRSVDELELSVRSANCLKAGNIDTLYDLVTKSESEMLKFRNFGRKSLNEIGELLEGMGLRFGMSFDDEVVKLVKGERATAQQQ